MKILWLSRDLDSNDVVALQKKHEMVVSEDFTVIDNSFDIVIVSNYDKIISEKYFFLPLKGIVVIHSSDLPKGKGWAPIYNSIANAENEYVVSLIKIDKKVDSGNILQKIRIKKPKYICNNNLRAIDEEAIIMLVDKFLENLDSYSELIGIEQNEEQSTYYKKRTKFENKLDKDNSLQNQILNILATNNNYASFIDIDGQTIEITAKNKRTYKLGELSFSYEMYI